MQPLLALWRDTWWLWIVFVATTVIMTAVVGQFFLLLIPCLPVVFVYFAFARYDAEGNEKPDLD